jgi:myo-inositol-1(or 4)-monophosphatase
LNFGEQVCSPADAFLPTLERMNKSELKRTLAAAVDAARAAGALMRKNLHAAKKINAQTQHDIKLDLDVRCQKLIERRLHRAFPQIAVLGEEGESRAANSAEHRWVVDPIDGTVNYAHGLPHACVSIALQTRSAKRQVSGVRSQKQITHHASRVTDYITVLGVVYDPFTDELWTALRGEPARLNGRPIRVSRRRTLGEAIVSIGFSKNKATVKEALPLFCRLARRARKMRIMGSAALGLTYVATGRLDAYIERRISLWDIAAGGLIRECAGGNFVTRAVAGCHRDTMLACKGRIDATG